VTVEKADELEDALRRALSYDGPALVDVRIARQKLTLPPKISYEQVKGFTLFATRTILSGGGEELLELVRATCARSTPNDRSQAHSQPDQEGNEVMTESVRYEPGMGAPPRTRAGTTVEGHTLFAQTMAYVAGTAATFALGAWSGHSMKSGLGFIGFILAFICLIAMRYTARRSVGLTVALLAAFGLLLGLSVGPVIGYYGATDPSAVWDAGGATALFIAGFGAAGYATRRDLAVVARISFWALLALIVFGIVLIFVNIPGGALAYSVLGLVIFAGFTMFDFQRLRHNQDISSAPLLAASIFLDILNVFLFFLEIFGGGNRE
jgi:modulator of FtsH protease